MPKKNHFIIAFVFIVILTFFYGSPKIFGGKTAASSDYEDLLSLFNEFREFQKVKIINSVPDYTAAAMEKRRHGLKQYQKRLAAIDISTWPVSQQVDYHMVRAEMNGLDFFHRVLRPWSRDPVFYLPGQGGSVTRMIGFSGLRRSKFPLSKDRLADFKMTLKAVPEIYEQARGNLRDVPGDLALLALHNYENEASIYRNLASQLAEHHSELVPDAERAAAAVINYGKWLKENKGNMTAPVGIGIENYNWWLKNVHLFPYTWDELVVIMEKEYQRAVASLKVQENKNRNLPPLKPVSSQEEYQRRWREVEQYIRNFARKEEIFPIPDYLVPYNIGTWWNAPGSTTEQDFFEKCRDLNMLSEQCHNFLGHHFDSLRHRRDKRPIRGARRLYREDWIRSEGLAFGLEELFMIAGLLDETPRAKEVNYIARAFRSVRGLADVKLHSNEFTLTEANQFCYDMTPYNWMIKDGHEVWYEMQTTLRTPGWHMGMAVGQSQLMKLITDQAFHLGEDFNLGKFMDEFLAAGMIPISLIRWEMTGLDDEIKKLW